MQPTPQINGAPRAEQESFSIESTTRRPDGGQVQRIHADWPQGYLLFIVCTDRQGRISLSACLRVIDGGHHGE